MPKKPTPVEAPKMATSREVPKSVTPSEVPKSVTPSEVPKVSVPSEVPKLVTPSEVPKVSVPREAPKIPSRTFGSARALSGAAQALQLAGQVLTVVGAVDQGERTEQLVLEKGGHPAIAYLNGVAATGVGILAGVGDDLFFTGSIMISGSPAPAVDMMNDGPSGPVQQLLGRGYRMLMMLDTSVK